ncbi:MAG: hypothetical protein ACK5D5_05550 [Bacteroidota bacterium]|jgi:hypothetical protein
MKKDIPIQEVKDVAVAVVREFTGVDFEWNVYLINLKKETIKNVLVSSRGYGSEHNPDAKTGTLRFFFDEIKPSEWVQIELIMENVFSLNNEYWVSFYIGENILDKRFIFLPESINEKNFVTIPKLEKQGVMIL